jgi:hypothetical protein
VRLRRARQRAREPFPCCSVPLQRGLPPGFFRSAGNRFWFICCARGGCRAARKSAPWQIENAGPNSPDRDARSPLAGIELRWRTVRLRESIDTGRRSSTFSGAFYPFRAPISAERGGFSHRLRNRFTLAPRQSESHPRRPRVTPAFREPASHHADRARQRGIERRPCCSVPACPCVRLQVLANRRRRIARGGFHRVTTGRPRPNPG